MSKTSKTWSQSTFQVLLKIPTSFTQIWHRVRVGQGCLTCHPLSFLGNCEEELSKNLSADCRPTVGRLSAVCRPSVGRLLPDCWLSVGRLSADYRPTVSRLSAVCCPTVGCLLAVWFSPKYRLSVGRQMVMCR